MVKFLLPAYTIRISDRAKYLRLRVSSEHGLEVIVPKDYDQTRIEPILLAKQAWITKTLGNAQARTEFHKSQPLLPSEVNLQAIAQIWQVNYEDNITTPKAGKYSENPNLKLLLNTNSPDLCHQLLRHWLLSMGDRYLAKELKRISLEIGLPFSKVTIRQQKTLWGSCSQSKNISLNYKLLFLPPALVRYVLIHELCHTIHLNHSSKFWKLVQKFEPNYLILDPQLRDVWQMVPAWAAN
ncbi:putative metal-dependent hydrolase [Synechococcus sp. PCC 7502]|uniref:M48 family metallopeptidase n=1 Tax=Synechococcus sp. PCC 7502 TaxID=1173263 RepID=UPI00029F995B|nr:SprT family zinc-dependent metalloprotease [Synechococcus sp. PCC 7502]AFY72733.1 putative metal-dependent hydrolase [Synechococcus sp. PCC 7502]